MCSGKNKIAPSPVANRDRAISFAYGNLKIDRPDLKRGDVEREDDELHPHDVDEATGCANDQTWRTEGVAAIRMLLERAKEPLFYIQDTRQVVGNSAFWWCVDGKGYTANLDKAWKVPGTWSSGRPTDVLRPVAEVDALVERHVDVQRLPGVKVKA